MDCCLVRYPLGIPEYVVHGCVRPLLLTGVLLDIPASRSIDGYERGSVWVWRGPVIWYEAGLSSGMRQVSVVDMRQGSVWVWQLPVVGS